jgi:hypothetical protein
MMMVMVVFMVVFVVITVMVMLPSDQALLRQISRRLIMNILAHFPGSYPAALGIPRRCIISNVRMQTPNNHRWCL